MAALSLLRPPPMLRPTLASLRPVIYLQPPLSSSNTRHFHSSPRRTEEPNSNPQPLLTAPDGFDFIHSNARPPKPRQVGLTEIRGPYYSSWGKRHLQDLLETFGAHIDGLKFGGGSFGLMPEAALRELIEIAHAHGVYVSTGGWIEHVLTQARGADDVDRYIAKVKDLGFDVLEVSAGFLSIPPEDFVRLVERVQRAGLKAKPELGIQFGAGGDTSAEELEGLGTSDPNRVVHLARRFVEELGVERIMIESEGITENVKSWRTDVIQAIMRDVPAEKVMFEAADPKVFNWYIREFGADVNLFVDHSQIAQLSCLRTGIWGMADTFGKVVTYR